MITIIDYGSGNAGSVKKVLDFIGVDCKITSKVEDILSADKVVLPGVGAFGGAMKNLRQKGLVEPLKDVIKKGTPYLGICIGLQLLFEESEENPGVKGLGVFKGKVLKFTKGKIPQIGWNSLETKDVEMFGSGGFVYFVNSYYVEPEEKDVVSARTEYGIRFVSAVRKDNVFAVQFHLEKSGDYGLAILKRWLRC